MSKFEPKRPKGSVPNGQSQFANRYAIRWFKCKLKPPKKRVKDGPIRKADSTEIPRMKYYRPAADAKTYRMNGQGQLQCQQDPKDMTRVGSVKELPLCREGNIP